MIRFALCFLMMVPSLGWGARKSAPAKKPAPAKVQLEEVGIPKGRYITGGVLGSTLGFGVGHAVQQRYRHYAWLFTIGESAAIAYFWSNTLFACEGSSGAQRDSCLDETDRKRTIATIAFLSFRIWEAIDVWTGVKVAADKVTLVPGMLNSNTPGLALALKF